MSADSLVVFFVVMTAIGLAMAGWDRLRDRGDDDD